MERPARTLAARAEAETTGGDARIARLEARIEQLEQVRADLEQFASVLCHDLQAPITVQQLKAAVIRRLLDKGDIEGAKEATTHLDTVNQQMSAMIQAVLGFSRAGNARLQTASCPLNTVVGNAIAMHEMDVRTSKAVIDVEELPTVEGDEGLLTLLMQNLIGNAIKYCRPGTVPRIRISAPRDAAPGHVAITIEDNGIGFDPAAVQKIMQPFERLHTDVPGHGIGLATCMRIVQRHHGTLTAEGRPGVGATFRVELPGHCR